MPRHPRPESADPRRDAAKNELGREPFPALSHDDHAERDGRHEEDHPAHLEPDAGKSHSWALGDMKRHPPILLHLSQLGVDVSRDIMD
jgi:hypothetical protein